MVLFGGSWCRACRVEPKFSLVFPPMPVSAHGINFEAVTCMAAPANTVEIAAEILSAYVSNNSLPAAELPTLLGQIHAALVHIEKGTAPVAAPEPQVPAVSAKKSITNDFLICLEDGRRFKSLKRHLRTSYDMTPEQYREKWNLPRDYPMVAPAYAKARSTLAKSMGLGQQRRKKKPASAR
jgi:predicted transcriptional regulator